MRQKEKLILFGFIVFFIFLLRFLYFENKITVLSYVSEVKEEILPERISTLLFVGDIMLSRDVGRIMEEKKIFYIHFA
jgi:hypothetical protein